LALAGRLLVFRQVVHRYSPFSLDEEKIMANPSRKAAARRIQSHEQRSVSFNSGEIASSKKKEAKKPKHRDATRWSNAIRAVLKEEDEQHQQKQPKNPKRVDEIKDPIGDHMTILLNSNPAFRFVPNQDALDDTTDDSFHPLFSSHNLNRLKEHFVLILRPLAWSDIPRAIVGISWLVFAWFFKNACSWRDSTIVFLMLASFTACVLGVGFFVAFEWTFHGAILLVSIVAPLLVDWKELELNCPEVIRNAWIRFIELANWVDTRILQGRRFAGREWDKSDFIWKRGKEAESRMFSLWNLPPPSVKEGRRLCLDEEYMARDEWSAATTKHIVAIHFCYVVLREDYVRQQAYRKTQHGLSSTSKLASKKRDKSNLSRNVALEGLVEVERPRRLYKKSYSLDEFDIDGVDVGDSLRINRSMEEPPSPPAPSLDRVLHYMATESLEPSSASSSAFPSSDGSTSFERRLGSRRGSEQSLATLTDTASDLAWIDVGAKIGLRLLNSANVQRAMASQDTAERIKAISQSVESKFRLNRRASYGDGNFSNSNLTTENHDGPAHMNGADREPDVSLPLSRPVHSMWTSASAVAATPGNFSVSSLSDAEDESSIDSMGRAIDVRNPLLRPRWAISDSDKLPTSSQPDAVLLHNRVRTETPVANSAVMRTESSKAVQAVDEALPVGKRSGIIKRENVAEHYASPRKSSGVKVSHAVHRRPALEAGMKIVIPVIPIQPGLLNVSRKGTQYQMATVVSSKRIFVARKALRPPTGGGKRYEPNCLSVTAKLDKSFLRDGEFAEITIRILDEWSPRYMPRHSKFSIGACVATAYGVGVLVGWRVEDDCHVVRALWQRRGPGAAHAYLNRNAIHATITAAIGFNVQTNLGEGKVLAYVSAGRDFRSGRYCVAIQGEEERYKDQAYFSPKNIKSCPGARFLPILEHIRKSIWYMLTPKLKLVSYIYLGDRRGCPVPNTNRQLQCCSATKSISRQPVVTGSANLGQRFEMHGNILDQLSEGN
jgi:hypothetical protein